MSKEIDSLMLDLKRKILKPVYFLSGEEPFYIDLVSDYIEHHILEEVDREFNQHIVYGKDADLTSILGLAKQFPMMGDYQVVIVKEAQNIKELNKSSGGDESSKSSKSTANSATQQFISYLQNPQATTILVLCFKYKTIDKRSSLAKLLQKNSVYIESKKLYDNQVPEWISTYVKSKNFSATPKATYLLSEFLGNDLSKIANEINKLIINLPPSSEITPDIIQENIGISKDFNIFELQDALSKKDILKTNQIINYFAANEKEHPTVMTLNSLFSYFSKLLKFAMLPDKSKFAAAGALGVNPFFIDGYAKAAQNYNTLKLKHIFYYLKEYDLKTKGVENSGINNGELMKELMFKILH
jgi:DNA polymerase III subunit delta